MTVQGSNTTRVFAQAALATGLFAATAAHAATITFTDRASFEAAAGNLTVEQFNEPFVTDATNPTPLKFDGFEVTETQGIPNLHWFNVNSNQFLHVQADNPSTVVFEFDSPITAFGVLTIDFAREAGIAVGETETITYLDNSPGAAPIEVISATSSESGVGVGRFFGVVNDTDSFDTVTLTFSTGATSIGPFNGDDVGLEDLAFATAVPLPPAVIAFASALVVLAARRRRRS